MMNVGFTSCKSTKHFWLQVPGPDLFLCEICFLRELAFVKRE
jgi:hypothetical protein